MSQIAAFAFLSRLVIAGESQRTNEVLLKYEQPKHLTGSIYAMGSGRQKLLYRFERRATRSGSTLNVERDFTYPDGKPAAREKVVYQGNDLVSYVLEELQTGGEGRAMVRYEAREPGKGTVAFEYSSHPGSKPRSRTESLREDTLANDMVGRFLADNWDALARGEKLKCRYIVVPRTETVGFTFSKSSESSSEHGRVILVKMEPTSRIIGALVDPLFFTIESTPPYRVLEYTGRTTPKLEAGGKWKDLDALTVFDWQ